MLYNLHRVFVDYDDAQNRVAARKLSDSKIITQQTIHYDSIVKRNEGIEEKKNTQKQIWLPNQTTVAVVSAQEESEQSA